MPRNLTEFDIFELTEGRPESEHWMYRAICEHVVDGDTFDFLVDLGFYTYQYMTIRLKDIDTPEIRGSEREEGLRVKQAVEELLLHNPCYIVTEKDTATSFGRFVADVYIYVEHPSEIGPYKKWTDLKEYILDYFM